MSRRQPVREARARVEPAGPRNKEVWHRTFVALGEACSLVSNGEPTKQIRLDFPLDNHHYAAISNVGDTTCRNYYIPNPAFLAAGQRDYPDYNGGSTNSWGPDVFGRTCILIFTGKRS
jgi:hypothetical protein